MKTARKAEKACIIGSGCKRKGSYDQENGTDYLEILIAYFENECSIINTAKSLYCHKNTMTYKINKIKDILGYDILDNENRMKIMISIHIMKLRTGRF